MASTTENPNEENIKCVVIGDNNVGKTKLVCARAYSNYGPNNGCLRYGGQHIPTVWANDHYRNDSEVLKNARDCVDGVDVSLRLWDTFGDHNKNRKFSYGRADVVLMCFSVCDIKSLQNIIKFWLPEVRKHCKFIPVLLVACKADLRFADLEELNKRKNTLVKRIRLADILFPEVCRRTASEIGCPYYETSVCSGYAVKELFQNAIRAALTHRRKMYLYRKPSLKHVQKPLLVKPLVPSKPKPPVFPPVEDEPHIDFSELYNDSLLSDITIICQNTQFHGHKAILATTSNVFHRLFMLFDGNPKISSKSDPLDGDITPSNDVFLMTMKELTISDSPPEAEEDDAVPNLLAINNQNTDSDTNMRCSDPIAENVSAFSEKDFSDIVSEFEFVQSYVQARDGCTDILCLKPHITLFSFLNIMKFCYTSQLNPEFSSPNWFKKNIQLFTELFITSQQFGIYVLPDILTQLLNEGNGFNSSIKKYIALRKNSILQLVLWKETYSDVLFKVDDGSVPGHKPFLVSGCDMMNAMFGGTYVESENKEIYLPGTTVQSLQAVFEYIYTKSVPSLANCDVDYNDLIALADRLCLPKLISLLEQHIIRDFTNKSLGVSTSTFYENVILSLESAQMHNAPRLYEWCVYFLSSNYNDACKKCKLIKTLSESNLKILEMRRWPPVWFIKDQDNYEKACKERAREESEGKGKYKGSKKY